MNNYAIEVKDLHKSYKDKEVLKGINLKIENGSIFALLGSNGAGKTTLIKILTTLSKIGSGSCSVSGFNVATKPNAIKKCISLTGQFAAVDKILTAKENMVMIAKLKHLNKYELEIDDLLTKFELFEHKDRMVSTFSGGMLRKLDLAMSLLGNPKIIFLDEPTTGLDPQGRIEIWNMIKKLKESGTTIFLTTQYLDEAEQLADIIAIIDEGIIKEMGTKEELKKLITENKLIVNFNDASSLERVKLLFDEIEIDKATNQVTFKIKNVVSDLLNILSKLNDNNIDIIEFYQPKPTIEDVFLNVVYKGDKNE